MNELCERVRLAEMALLDGETPPLPIDEARAHQVECAGCRDAVAAMRATHLALDRLPFEPLRVDMWARVGPAIASERTSAQSVRAGLAAVAVLIAWRVAQIAVEWPAALAVSSAALATVAAVGWMVTSNVLAIRSSISELRQEGVR